MAIDQLYAQGDDALQNQFEMSISPISLFNTQDPLRFRVTTLDIPEFTVGTYTVPYKTQQIEKPSGKIETPTEFTFNFRVDKYWTVYSALMIWKNYIADENTGAMAEDVGALSGTSDNRTDIIVKTIDSNDVVTSTGWTFYKAWPKGIGGVSFDQNSGDPIEVTITMSFLKMVSSV